MVRQIPSGQMTTIMLASAHPGLHAVARAMCGSSFLALRCFHPAPFPSVSTCGEQHVWVVPFRRSASGETPPPADGNIEVQELVNSDNKMWWWNNRENRRGAGSIQKCLKLQTAVAAAVKAQPTLKGAWWTCVRFSVEIPRGLRGRATEKPAAVAAGREGGPTTLELTK